MVRCCWQRDPSQLVAGATFEARCAWTSTAECSAGWTGTTSRSHTSYSCAAMFIVFDIDTMFRTVEFPSFELSSVILRIETAAKEFRPDNSDATGEKKFSLEFLCKKKILIVKH